MLRRIVGVHELNFCVRDGRELERRLRRMQRERSVCSGRQNLGKRKPEDFVGHRKRKQVDCPTVPKQKKEPGLLLTLFVFALPIFPGSRPGQWGPRKGE